MIGQNEIFKRNGKQAVYRRKVDVIFGVWSKKIGRCYILFGSFKIKLIAYRRAFQNGDYGRFPVFALRTGTPSVTLNPLRTYLALRSIVTYVPHSSG